MSGSRPALFPGIDDHTRRELVSLILYSSKLWGEGRGGKSEHSICIMQIQVAGNARPTICTHIVERCEQRRCGSKGSQIPLWYSSYSNIRGETAKSLPECKAVPREIGEGAISWGEPLDPSSNRRARYMTTALNGYRIRLIDTSNQKEHLTVFFLICYDELCEPPLELLPCPVEVVSCGVDGASDVCESLLVLSLSDDESCVSVVVCSDSVSDTTSVSADESVSGATVSSSTGSVC